MDSNFSYIGLQSTSLAIDTQETHLAGSFSVLGYLAGKDVSEGGEGIIHRLVVDGFIQVLDEDVADPRSSKRRITLAPHDPDGAPLQDIKIHRVQGSLG